MASVAVDLASRLSIRVKTVSNVEFKREKLTVTVNYLTDLFVHIAQLNKLSARCQILDHIGIASDFFENICIAEIEGLCEAMKSTLETPFTIPLVGSC